MENFRYVTFENCANCGNFRDDGIEQICSNGKEEINLVDYQMEKEGAGFFADNFTCDDWE